MSLYIVPMEAFTHPKYGPGVQPKYIPILGVAWAICKFGVTVGDPVLVWADTSPAQETAVASNADAILIPPLDNTVPASQAGRDTVRAAIELLDVPAQWVQSGMSYRVVLRVLMGMANLMQRLRGRGQPTKLAGNLDRALSTFSAQLRQELAAASDDLKLDRTGVTGATTLREALRVAGEQFMSRPTRFGNQVV